MCTSRFRRCADRRRDVAPGGPERRANRGERRREIGMRRAARGRLRAGREDRVERALARRPDVEADDHRRRRDAVQHDAAHASGYRRRYSSATRVPYVPPHRLILGVAQRRAHGVEVVDPGRRRVLRGIDAARGEFPRAGAAFGTGSISSDCPQLAVRLERRARERRRAARAALVDEHDVAVLRTPVSCAAKAAMDDAAWPGPPARMNRGSGSGTACSRAAPRRRA